MANIKELFNKIFIALRSPRGRDAMMFLVFVVISAILWGVLSLNEEEQYDVKMPLKITHQPDSVTLITPGPDAINVSVRARGSELLKMSLGNVPSVNVDFRAYRSGNHLFLSNAELKGLARNSLGGTQVSVLFPDSISIPFTTQPGTAYRVSVDYKIYPGPQSAVVGNPKLSQDTVLVYSASMGRHRSAKTIRTEEIRLEGIDKTTTRRVKLIPPSGCRAIPDSIDVTFEIEPLILKKRTKIIRPINVPSDTKVITFPAQVDVIYMVPMSSHKDSEPEFEVVADYKETTKRPGNTKIKLKLVDVPNKYQNVHLSTDSAEYLIERL